MKSVSMMLVGASLAAAAVATPAAAATYIATYTGTVTRASGLDNTTKFGLTSNNLEGQAFSARYVIDTSKGESLNYGHAAQTYGGLIYNLSSPILSATITINGVTESVDTRYKAGFIGGHSYGRSDNSIGVYQGSTEGFIESSSSLNNSGYRYDETIPVIFGPFSAQFHGSGGQYSSYVYDYQTDTLIEDYTLDLGTEAVSVVDPNAVVAVAAVPEPATWAMMVLGFGVVGASIRRRKSNVRTNVRFA